MQKKAIEELGLDAEIEKVEDLEEISARGVMMNPALAIDGEIKVKGEVLNPKKIKELLE